jgi:hypothetical protein
VINIIDEASQVLAYSRQLEQKSRELEAATNELRSANRRLQELDRLKDDFISTGHARAAHAAHVDPGFLEILTDNPALDDVPADEVPRHHRQGVGAPDAPHQPGARPGQIESGNAEWQSGRDRHAGGDRRCGSRR